MECPSRNLRGNVPWSDEEIEQRNRMSVGEIAVQEAMQMQIWGESRTPLKQKIPSFFLWLQKKQRRRRRRSSPRKWESRAKCKAERRWAFLKNRNARALTLTSLQLKNGLQPNLLSHWVTDLLPCCIKHARTQNTVVNFIYLVISVWPPRWNILIFCDSVWPPKWNILMFRDFQKIFRDDFLK